MASFKAKFPVLQELFAKNHRGGPLGPPPAGRGLKARGLACKGSKEKLRLRLAEAVESEQDNIEPNDSASHAGSRVSTAESLILKQADEAADRAGLAARLNALKEKQEVEKQIAELKRREEILSLEAEVAEVSAREEAIKRFHEQVITGSTVSRIASPVPSAPVPVRSEPVSGGRDEERHRLRDAAVIEDPPCLPSAAADNVGAALAAEGSNVQVEQRLAQEREQTAALMRLPPIEMKKFGGDVTDFAQFIRSFELKIASKLDSEQEKLHYLEQNTVPGSKPHAIVTSCIYLEDGYEQALSMLRKRYGQPSNIAAAFMDRINSFSPIKANDVEVLDRFALLLLSCKNALGTSEHMMGDPRTMRAVTGKLSDAMLNSWRRHADEIEERQGRAVKFEDVVKFVGDEARIASNPTYGRLMYSPSCPSCSCGHKFEDTAHYILRCPKYTTHRSNLLSAVRPMLRHFDDLSDKHKLDTLLFGRSLSEAQGISIAHHLQTFIAHSRRLNTHTQANTDTAHTQPPR